MSNVILRRDNVDMNVDYDKLSFIESHFAHELKRLGAVRFVEEYSYKLKDSTKDKDKMEMCFLMAFIEHLDKSIDFHSTIKMDKYVLDSRDFLYIELDDDLKPAQERMSRVLPEFLKRGFVFSEVEEAV